MTTPKPGDVAALEVSFLCPFCDGSAGATRDAGGAVFHSLPYCAKFEQLGPTEFLAAVNKEFKAGKGRPVS